MYRLSGARAHRPALGTPRASTTAVAVNVWRAVMRARRDGMPKAREGNNFPSQKDDPANPNGHQAQTTSHRSHTNPRGLPAKRSCIRPGISPSLRAPYRTTWRQRKHIALTARQITCAHTTYFVPCPRGGVQRPSHRTASASCSAARLPQLHRMRGEALRRPGNGRTSGPETPPTRLGQLISTSHAAGEPQSRSGDRRGRVGAQASQWVTVC